MTKHGLDVNDTFDDRVKLQKKSQDNLNKFLAPSAPWELNKRCTKSLTYQILNDIWSQPDKVYEEEQLGTEVE